MYLVFTRMPGERYPGRLRSLLLCLCDVFRALTPLCVDSLPHSPLLLLFPVFVLFVFWGVFWSYNYLQSFIQNVMKFEEESKHDA